MDPVLVKIIEDEKPKSIFAVIESRLKSVASIIGSLTIISGVVLSALSMSGAEGQQAVNSFFNNGKKLFGLNKSKDPVVSDIVAIGAPETVLGLVGWSFLGNNNNKEGWYYPALKNLDIDEFQGQIVKPKTDMYLRETWMSVANPSPNAIGTIKVKNDYDQCLRVLDTNVNSDSGSIWLKGEKVDCT